MMKLIALLLLVPTLGLANGDDYTGSIKGKDVTVGGGVKFSSTPVGFISAHMSHGALSSGGTFFVFTPSSAMTILRLQYSQNEVTQASGPAYVRCNNSSGNSGIQVDFDLNDGSFGFSVETISLFNVNAQEKIFCHGNYDALGGSLGTFNIIMEYRMQ